MDRPNDMGILNGIRGILLIIKIPRTAMVKNPQRVGATTKVI
jgi:hypothetical protein